MKATASKDEGIHELLDRLGGALTTGNALAAARCWETPAFYLDDKKAMVLADEYQIEKLFAQATQQSHAQGIVATKAELERVEPLSDRLTAIDVRWPGIDSSGKETSSERSHYVVHRGEDGRERIRFALTRTTQIAET